jgi:hypothetical protein
MDRHYQTRKELSTMDELVKLVAQKTGLSQDQAKVAADVAKGISNLFG